MKKTNIRGWNTEKLCALVVLGIAGACFAQSLNLTGSIGGHDPVLIKEGNTYYIFHTGNAVSVKTSPNMLNWSNAGSVLPSTFPSWFSQYVPNKTDRNIWAPDISYRNGQYWLYYSVSTFGSQTSAIGLSTRTSLSSGSWQDQGMVIASPASAGNYNAIDPNPITDIEGNVWMNWGSWWNGIFITRINPQTGKPLTNPPTASSVTNIARRNNGIEGSYIVHARGYYHLFVSFDNCCQGASSNYNMRYGRSLSITGPYLDRAGTSMLSGGGTLLSDGSGQPGGHNGVFEENGNWYLIYHAYTPGNTIRIRRLFFDAQGWPTFDSAAGVPILPLQRAPTFRGLIPASLYDPLGRRMALDGSGKTVILP